MKTNNFIRDCVTLCTRFSNAGHTEAARLMLHTVQRAIHSPRDTAPLQDYARDVAAALRDVFGWDHDLADASHRVQLEAVALWSWYEKTFDTRATRSMHAAIKVADQHAFGWRQKVLAVFANDPERLHNDRQRAKWEAFDDTAAA